MYSPAVFLHKGQKFRAAKDTVEILQALTDGKIVLVEGSAPVTTETPESEPKQEVNPEAAENEQSAENAPETVKPTRRGLRK